MQARFLLALLLAGCALTHDRPTPQCDVLELGDVRPATWIDAEGRERRHRQFIEVVSLDDHHVVGWPGPDGYELRAVSGCEVVAQRTMELDDPYLFLEDGDVVVATFEDGVWAGHALDSVLATMGTGPVFEQSEGLVLDRNPAGEPARLSGGIGAASFDGATIASAGTVAHGACDFGELEADGETFTRPRTFDHRWGCDFQDRDWGAYLDPRARETGRHAAVMSDVGITPGVRGTTTAVEGGVENHLELAADDAAITWSGAGYDVAVAEGGVSLVQLDDEGRLLAPLEDRQRVASQIATHLALRSSDGGTLALAFLDEDHAYLQLLSR